MLKERGREHAGVMRESPNGLEPIGPHLIRLTELVREMRAGQVEYKLDVGRCSGTGLLNTPAVAVQDSTMSAGAVFPAHTHDVYEVLVVYAGSIRVTRYDEDVIIAAPAAVCIPIDTPHCVEALSEAHIIGVTIPRSPGYPNAGTT